MYALNLAEDGRVLSATDPKYAPNAVTVVTLPDGDIYEYRLVDGVFVHDPLPVPEEPTVTEEPTADDVLNALLGVE